MTDEPNWNAVQRAIDKKRDDEMLREAAELMKSLPTEIQELVEGGRVIPPSEVKADPTLSMIDQLLNMKLLLTELEADYRSALRTIGALVQTYGVPNPEQGPKAYKVFVSSAIVEALPNCVTVQTERAEGTAGGYVLVSPHACDVNSN